MLIPDIVRFHEAILDETAFFHMGYQVCFLVVETLFAVPSHGPAGDPDTPTKDNVDIS
jgi:hypothetical protein